MRAKPTAEANALRRRYTDAAFGATGSATLSQPSLQPRHHAANALLGGRSWQTNPR